MKYLNPIILTSLVCLTGCASPVTVVDYYDLSSDALGNMRGMTFLQEQILVDGEYADLGIVEGFSCRRDPRADVMAEGSKTMKIALEQLKLNAAASGGAHVTTPQCVINEGMDLSNNCFDSLTCTAHAVARAPL